MSVINKTLQDIVRTRAGHRCEYCRLPATWQPIPFHIEHIVAQSHGGPTEAGNLALACMRCNCHKGPNLSGLDPQDGEIVPLFHPRTQVWTEHFAVKDDSIVGTTPTGRATVQVLKMNEPTRRDVRRLAAEAGLWPWLDGSESGR